MSAPEPRTSPPVVELREVADDDVAIFYEHQREAEGNRMDGFPARDRDAYVAKGNVSSIRVLEKCGFVRAGESAAHDGEYDELVFTLER